MTSVGALLAAVDPSRPLLTWYDDGTGERTELSGATVVNWVAKTANLLVDGVGAGPGDDAIVLLPPHWQTAAVLLGAWTVGLSVAIVPGPGEVGFSTVDRATELAQPERYLLGLHPLGLPLREVPPGYLDFAAEVRGYGDAFPFPRPAPVPAGGRVLVDVDAHPDPAQWLLGPLEAGESIVLCGRLDRSRLAGRVEVERVTRILVD